MPSPLSLANRRDPHLVRKDHGSPTTSSPISRSESPEKTRIFLDRIAPPVGRSASRETILSSLDSIAISHNRGPNRVSPAPPPAAALKPSEPVPHECVAGRSNHESKELPSGLIWVCVDDDMMARMVAESLLVKAAADVSHSLILGSSYAEVEHLVDTVADLEAQFGSDRVVLVIDQNLCFDEALVLGTDLSRELRVLHAFNGIIIIQSAEDDAVAHADYKTCGADGCVGKSQMRSSGKIFGGMLEQVAMAWHARHRGCDSQPAAPVL